MADLTELMLNEYPVAWSTQDKDKILMFFTDDCIYEDATLGLVKNGKQELAEFVDEVFTTYPDFQITYQRCFANDSFGASEWTISVTWTGPFHEIDVTGIKTEIKGVTLFEFKDGKIHRNSDYWDMVPLLKQLGVLTEELRENCK